MFFFSSFKPQ